MIKSNTLAEQSVTWTGTKGNAVAVRVALVETTTDHGGQLLQPVRERGGLRVVVTALVDGRERGQGLTVYQAARQGVAADVGQVVGLNAERLALVRDAIDAVRQHPEWQAQEAAKAAAAVNAAQHRAAHARIVRAMGE